MKMKIVGIVLLIVLVLLVTGCVSGWSINRMEVGPTQTDSETVELGNAETARVDVNMGVGKVVISGGANELMEADFTYNVEDWRPDVSYDVSGDEGRLTVRQPDSDFEGIPDDEIEYEWDVRLNDDVPMDLDVELGVGDSKLNLRGLSLTSLDVRAGVGAVTVDLTGNWERSFDVDVRGGVGQTKIILPTDVGVRVDTQTGLGSVDVHGLIRDGNVYTNAAYDSAEVILDINIQGGVGEIDLELGE